MRTCRQEGSLGTTKTSHPYQQPREIKNREIALKSTKIKVVYNSAKGRCRREGSLGTTKMSHPFKYPKQKTN